MEHQLAAVDARRDSIKAQADHGRARCSTSWAAPWAYRRRASTRRSTRPSADEEVVDDADESDLVEVTEQAFDRADEAEDGDRRRRRGH